MTEINLKNIKKAYFIGIGGIGMSAVARMLLQEGKEVYGSDLSASHITEELEKLGAHIHIGKPQATLPEDVDVVIYTVAISDTHSEFVSAKAKNIPTISYPESLGLISKDKFTIAIAGTHGKTTTTAMVAQVLIDAGLDPTVIVGSLLKSGTNFIAGKSKYLVVEACEYKRSFLNIKPDIAIITNIDDDHLDYYKNLEGIQKGFSEFLSGMKSGGVLVTNTDDKNIAPILS
ncbi:MAG TPA: Mur ligase family protein, partial [Candidatus Nanoarchaeia archaeon]|nr:Mur ligase family protein [Candidatus Nanoarchaeia archaeon]